MKLPGKVSRKLVIIASLLLIPYFAAGLFLYANSVTVRQHTFDCDDGSRFYIQDLSQLGDYRRSTEGCHPQLYSVSFTEIPNLITTVVFAPALMAVLISMHAACQC